MTLHTHKHILYDCKIHFCHCHLLGPGNAWRFEVLLGSERGIIRLAQFIKASGVYDKHKDMNPNNGDPNRGRNEGGSRVTGIG